MEKIEVGEVQVERLDNIPDHLWTFTKDAHTNDPRSSDRTSWQLA